jgi:hypothetical protein
VVADSGARCSRQASNERTREGGGAKSSVCEMGHGSYGVALSPFAKLMSA